MRIAVSVLALGFLVSCGPPVPDSGAAVGPGFNNYQDYSTYRNNRDAELNGRAAPETIPGPNVPPPLQSASNTPPPAQPSELANGRTSDPSNPGTELAQLPSNDPGISDEQDFGAVSGRQSIESDAERLRILKENYQVIEPTAVPTRSGSGGPNIVAYAISTSNPVGQKIYRRSLVGGEARAARNCAKYATADLAQEAFLRAGGPERDKLGVDPDGDGFACDWDPTPFRAVSRG